MDQFDFGDDARPAVTETGFVELDKLVHELQKAEAKVASIEAELKTAQQIANNLSDQLIPEQLDAMGLADFTTTDGLEVSVSKNLRHSITKDRKAAAIAWLRANGHGDIIKNVIKIQFGVGEEEQAQALVEKLLKEQGPRTSREEDVASATVKSVLVQLLEDGVNVPLDLFGAFEQRRAKIKQTKTKK